MRAVAAFFDVLANEVDGIHENAKMAKVGLQGLYVPLSKTPCNKA